MNVIGWLVMYFLAVLWLRAGERSRKKQDARPKPGATHQLTPHSELSRF